MKKLIITAIIASALNAKAQSPNPIPLGTEVLERITFSEGEPSADQRTIENLTTRSLRNFEGQIMLVVYHTAW